MPDVPIPPKFHADDAELLRKLADTTRGLLDGRSNNRLMVTLAYESEQTVIRREGVTADTAVALMPCSAAAASFPVWVETGLDTITLHHEAIVDEQPRTYKAIVVG